MPLHPSPADPPPSHGDLLGSLALVVAPSTGRFRPVLADARVRAGALLGHVVGGRGRLDEVRAPVAGRVATSLVRPGQLVRRGDVVAALVRA